MSDGVPYGDLIVIGAVALFVILRYRSILGQKTGHDFSKPKPRPDSVNERVIHLPERDVLTVEPDEPPLPKLDLALDKLEDVTISATIAKMKDRDPSFTLDEFIQGARAAFDMVLEAYSEHDRETLRMLLSKEVYESFESDLARQDRAHERTKTTLVSLMRAEVTGASMNKSVASITMQFESEQIQVTRDKDDKVVGGDVSDIQKIADEWVFERDLKSRNPNWSIVAT